MAAIAAFAMISCSDNDFVDNYTESATISSTETRMNVQSKSSTFKRN